MTTHRTQPAAPLFQQHAPSGNLRVAPSRKPLTLAQIRRMHPNSRASWRSLEPSARCRAIIEALQAHGPSTDRQVAGYLGTPDLNCVRPRITEMTKAGVLRDVGNVVCVTTRTRVRLVDISPTAGAKE